MSTISHRELRNQSAEVLRRVEAGERFVVTNNGRPVAELTPISRSGLDQARALGQVREARGNIRDFLNRFTPVQLPVSSEELLREARGKW